MCKTTILASSLERDPNLDKGVTTVLISHEFPTQALYGHYSGSAEQFKDAIEICEQECSLLVRKDKD